MLGKIPYKYFADDYNAIDELNQREAILNSFSTTVALSLPQ
ncbi:MAG: hypothetical protein ACTMUB_01120 [cyanobacterium endosymbiont of Rhopalodia musculus]|nr:hypothetical protein [cyanobacterium endosymbiont of Epithemia clementina EcSB]WGT66868.1 hypothetical protein P3F56_06335 [cyanobacterium endosymbiont of Epithemia clementina EcSB]